jgi:hypothetical protein
VELIGDEFSVVVEGLVEVAETEEEDGIGVALLEFEVLQPDRRGHAALLPGG